MTVYFVLAFQVQAQGVTPTSSVVRGLKGDLWADIVLGKTDFGEGIPGEVVGFKVMNPGGVVIDRSVQPDVVYTYDGANSRVLGFTSLGFCSDNNTLKCSTNSDCRDVNHSTSTCNLTSGKSADFVLGQPDLNHSACNHDSNYQNYPNRAPASADSLCSIPTYQVSTTEGGSFANMAVDSRGNLYVPDFDNNRILKFIKPYATDTIADSVWGQANFTGNGCNRGKDWENLTKPGSNTLCLRSYYNQGFGGGVDIDQSGNMWVADNQNNRVLRFPYNSNLGEPDKNADLVLGQPNFSSASHRNSGSSCDSTTEYCDYDPEAPMNNFWAPAAVRIDHATNKVYVADQLNSRILVFSPPFSNGMTASSTFATRRSERLNTDYFPNHYPKNPSGIEFDPNSEGVWINDTGNSQVVLFDFAGNPIKVLGKDTFQPNATCGSMTPQQSCLNPQTDAKGNSVCWNFLCGSSGSIGIDRDNNLLIASSSIAQDMKRFSAPIPTINPGMLYSAQQRFFYPPEGLNYSLGKKGLTVPLGVAVTDNQLILADTGNDQGKLMYWNLPNGLPDLINGKEADGVAAVPDFTSQNPNAFIGKMAVWRDKLWVINKGRVGYYNLPLTFGATPVQIVFNENTQLPVLGGGSLEWSVDDFFMGIAFDSAGNLWLTESREHPPNILHRVLRIRNPDSNPLVDVILGQPSLSETMCNQYHDPNYPETYNYSEAYSHKAANTVCFPGAIKVDRYDNVWLADFSLEFKGNWRLMKFDKSLFENINSTALYAPNASFIINDLMALDMAFDSKDRMIVGINGYSKMFPAYFDKKTDGTYPATPTSYFNDLYSMPDELVLDHQDNLFITDLNRGRALVYLNPFNNPPRPTDIITPTVSISPTTAITLTPTPTNILTPSPSFTPTPTGISPTFTPTPTPTSVSNSLNINYMYSNVWTDVGDQTVTISLYQGATLIKKVNVIAGNIGGGTYQAKLYGTPVGVYDVVIKTDRHLSRRNKGVNLKTGNNYSVFTNPLLPGDINAGLGAGSDNTIDLLDYNRLSSEVGSAGKASDLDYDGTVNSLDYSILIQNFGFVGE